jgi:hypothetical protein
MGRTSHLRRGEHADRRPIPLVSVLAAEFAGLPVFEGQAEQGEPAFLADLQLHGADRTRANILGQGGEPAGRDDASREDVTSS